MLIRLTLLLFFIYILSPSLHSRELQVSFGSGQEQIFFDGQTFPVFRKYQYDLTYSFQHKTFFSSFSFHQSWEAASDIPAGYAGCSFDILHSRIVNLKKESFARIGLHHGLEYLELHPENFSSVLYSTILQFPLSAHFQLIHDFKSPMTAELDLKLPLATFIMSNCDVVEYREYVFFPDVPLLRNPLQGEVSAKVAYITSSGQTIFIRLSLFRLETESVQVCKTGFSLSGGFAIGRIRRNE